AVQLYFTAAVELGRFGDDFHCTILRIGFDVSADDEVRRRERHRRGDSHRHPLASAGGHGGSQEKHAKENRSSRHRFTVATRVALKPCRKTPTSGPFSPPFAARVDRLCKS